MSEAALQLALQLASAVGGVGGLLAVVVIFMWRKDAEAATKAYQSLVQQVVNQSEKFMDRMTSLEREMRDVVANNTLAFREVCGEVTEHDEHTKSYVENILGHERKQGELIDDVRGSLREHRAVIERKQ